jgi:hypothetical protein
LSGPPTRQEKVCVTCGRRFGWRKRWANSWDHVKACSRSCRRGPGPEGRRCEQAIRDLLGARGPVKTICPSEAARQANPDDWRPLMETVRRAARRMAHAGELEITQKGRVVDPSGFKGPIRLRLRRR